MLPRRLGAYSPTWLDQLTHERRARLDRRRAAGRARAGSRSTSARTSASPARRRRTRSSTRPEGEVHDAIRERLAAAPSFWLDLVAELELEREELHSALWDLAWAGEVTNDAFAPLRARRLTAVGEPARAGRGASPRRRGPAQEAIVGPLVADRGRCSATPPPAGPRLRAQAELMLERYGIVTRETVLAEGVPGGFSSLYGELSNLEMLGTARRGYFVEGLGGAQFALAGRGRAPAQPAARRGRVPDPRRDRSRPALRRRAALAEARPRAGARRAPRAPTSCCATATRSLYVERGGKGIVRLVELEGEELVEAVSQLAEAAREKRDPEARDRARRRRAGDRLRARGAAHRRRLQPPAAPARRRGLTVPEGDTIHRAARADERRARAAREIELAEAPNPRSPLHRRARELAGPHARARPRRAASTCSPTSPATSSCTATWG